MKGQAACPKFYGRESSDAYLLRTSSRKSDHRHFDCAQSEYDDRELERIGSKSPTIPDVRDESVVDVDDQVQTCLKSY